MNIIVTNVKNKEKYGLLVSQLNWNLSGEWNGQSGHENPKALLQWLESEGHSQEAEYKIGGS